VICLAWRRFRIENKDLRNSTKDYIRGHYLRLEALEEVMESSSCPEGPGGKGGIGRPTESKALKAAELSRDIEVVEKALKQLPEYYRRPVLDHIVFKGPWPRLANQKTYRHYQDKFVWFVDFYRERLPRL